MHRSLGDINLNWGMDAMSKSDGLVTGMACASKFGMHSRSAFLTSNHRSHSLWTTWGSGLVHHLGDMANPKGLADPLLDMKQSERRMKTVGPHVAKAPMKRGPTDEGGIGAVAWIVTVRTKSK